MLCGSLDGSAVWARMDTYLCMDESLRCAPETINILNELYSNIKKIKKKIKTESDNKF